MTEEQIRSEVAKVVCDNFLRRRETTSRYAILKKVQDVDILDQMELRGLVSATKQRDAYRPMIGTFALLGDENEDYQKARAGFVRSINALQELFLAEGSGVNHEVYEFAAYTNKLNSDEAPFDLVVLGLYLTTESGVLQRLGPIDILPRSFQITEQVIRIRDPLAWWRDRVAVSRQPLRPPLAPTVPGYLTTYGLENEDELNAEPFDQSGFWLLINSKVAAEARPRFEMGHYADAVEWALKVVAEEIRRRTGLKDDGAPLMNKAFSPKEPHLIFEDPIPDTQSSMQVGYMQIFAGAMTGIRNPKAHGMVHLERGRCIHFLFLASLLADKVDEAAEASRQGNN